MTQVVFRYDPPPANMTNRGFGSCELFNEDRKSLICGTEELVMKTLSRMIGTAIAAGHTVKVIPYKPKPQ